MIVKCLSIFLIKLLILNAFTKSTKVIRMNKTALSLQLLNSSCTPVAYNNSTVLGFGNCYQNIYYINLQVGTPPQSMNVQFDTGSNVLWLPIVGSGAFNPLKSSTYTTSPNAGSISYADGSTVSGFYGSDVVGLTNTSISVFPQILWVNQDGINYPFSVQGLIGMGYTTSPNILDLAYSNKQISSPIFALQIQNDTAQSVVYYDGIPQEIQDQTYYVPVAGKSYWQVRVIGVTIGSMDLTSSSASVAIIDSGTSYFYLNSKLYNSIISNFFSNCNLTANPPLCPCQEEYPTFGFMFQGIEVYIEPSQYMSKYNSRCTYLFNTMSTVSSILLGDIFFRNYIITFDKLNKRLGFVGNIGLIKSIQQQGVVLGGYILLGLLGVILILGIVFYCRLQQFQIKRYSSASQITNSLIYAPSSAITQRLL